MNESSARHIRLTPSFVRCAKRLVKRNPGLARLLRETIESLGADMHSPSLRSHRLKGELIGCWACRVTHGIRIVFELGSAQTIDGVTAETIVLLAVGSHDAVY
jgi:mRNA-degrading endonuclease YafQ of YafQ-DinJ toxin-antitoxin module